MSTEPIKCKELIVRLERLQLPLMVMPKKTPSKSSRKFYYYVCEDEIIHRKEEEINQVKIDIPERLKRVLVEDQLAIRDYGRLVTLPSAVTVKDIIKEYVKTKPNAETLSGNLIGWDYFGDALLYYFNLYLGIQLLYNEEEDQFDEVQKKMDTTPDTIYGAEHLLRLFVKLGVPLGYLRVEPPFIEHIKQHVQNFLKFLEINVVKYFSMNNYQNRNV